MNGINLRINELALKFFEGNNSKFAESLSTSEANIRNYRTKTEPKLDFLTKLSERFEISYEWLITGKPPMLLSQSGQDSSSTNQSTESLDMETEESKPMTTDERFDALIRQNDALIQSVQEAFKVIASHQRQAETNQEIMKQLLSMLNDSKKNTHIAVTAQGLIHQMVYD